jgi:uncharacterized protein YjbI with pentapeptide repeats
MVGRLLRVTGTVLVIAVAFVTPVLATSAPASADTVVNGCTIVANPTASNFTNCPGADLSGVDLSGDDLSFANLAGANLSNSGLIDCFVVSEFAGECQSANLADANLTEANLANDALLDCAALPPARIFACEAVNMEGANLSGANLSASNPPTVVTEFFASECGCGPNLTGAILTGANLTNTPFLPFVMGGSTATSSAGAVVNFQGPLFVTGAHLNTCSPPTGSTFPLGTTTVTCQVFDDFSNAATGTFPVTVNPIQTAINLSSSPNPSAVGDSVTYTASIFSIPVPASPPAAGGSVAFTDNGSPISGCSAQPLSGTSSGAQATCTTTPGATGAHNIVATYSGSGIFAGSASDIFTQVVSQVPCKALVGCNLSGLNFSDASFESADFQGANLAGANLSGANLYNANLQGANLLGANLSGAYLYSAKLKGANLNGVTWNGTTCPDFTNSDDDGGTCVGHL